MAVQPQTPEPVSSPVHDSYGRVLVGLLERVLAGDLATDWVSVERQVVSALEASVQLYEEHQVDERGRCLICREARWPWPRRAACTVHAAFASHMPTRRHCRRDRQDTCARMLTWLRAWLPHHRNDRHLAAPEQVPNIRLPPTTVEPAYHHRKDAGINDVGGPATRQWYSVPCTRQSEG